MSEKVRFSKNKIFFGQSPYLEMEEVNATSRLGISGVWKILTKEVAEPGQETAVWKYMAQLQGLPDGPFECFYDYEIKGIAL